MRSSGAYCKLQISLCLIQARDTDEPQLCKAEAKAQLIVDAR
jgi:hypothetical protein